MMDNEILFWFLASMAVILGAAGLVAFGWMVVAVCMGESMGVEAGDDDASD